MSATTPAVVVKDKVVFSTHGPPTSTNDEPLETSFIQKLFQFVREDKNPDRKWLIDVDDFQSGRKKVTLLNEVIPTSYKVASALWNLGIKSGDTVQIILPNSCHYFFPVFGAWLIGAAVSVSDPGLLGDLIVDQLEETNGKIIFCFQETAEKLQGKVGLPIVVLPDREPEQQKQQKAWPNLILWQDFLDMGGQELELENQQPTKMNDLMVVFWSSGTTGKPKGIQHTQKMLIYNLQQIQFPPGSTTIQSTCFYHIGGFFLPVIGGLYNQLCTTFLNPNRGIRPEAILKSCNEHNPLLLMIGAHHALQIGKFPVNKDWNLQSVRALAPMGSSVYSDLPLELKKHFPNLATPIFGIYGMTETGTISRHISPTNLGVLAEGCKAKILDPESDRLCGPREVGEIVVWTPTIMKGYLNRPEENNKFFCADGFVRTGDLGFYDETGILYYHDRLKSLIKYNNVHVFPTAIEDVFQKHPDVVEAGVFGQPDILCQELVTAVAILRKGSRATEDEVLEFVNSRVDEYNQVRGGVKFVSHIPRNPQGKILKNELTHLFKDKKQVI